MNKDKTRCPFSQTEQVKAVLYHKHCESQRNIPQKYHPVLLPLEWENSIREKN